MLSTGKMSIEFQLFELHLHCTAKDKMTRWHRFAKPLAVTVRLHVSVMGSKLIDTKLTKRYGKI